MTKFGPKVNIADNRDDRGLIVRLGRSTSSDAVALVSARRLTSQSRRLSRTSTGNRVGTFGTAEKAQRVTVKAYVAKHSKNSKSLLVRHAAYLTRHEASAEAEHAKAYSANRDEIDLKNELEAWADDRHHFRMIVSPEKAHELADMTLYVRRLMARVEQDLETKTEWVAINHRNTDHYHTHLLIRGRKADGTDLVIPRDVISHGIRDRASELATLELGKRSDREIRESQHRDAVASRSTRLDWFLDRLADSDRVIRVQEVTEIPFVRTEAAIIEKRLAFLQSLGLSEQVSSKTWRLQHGLIDSLKVMGKANDVIKNLHVTRGIDPDQLKIYDHREVPEKALIGVVVDRGGHEEQLRNTEFLLVKDQNDSLHYVTTRRTEALRHVGPGSTVSIKAGARGNRRIRSVSDHRLADQIHADAYTLLDRMQQRKQSGQKTLFSTYKPIHEALEQRKAWLLERGYVIEHHGDVRWKPNTLIKLRSKELDATAARLKEKLGLPVRWLGTSEKVQVTGRSVGSLSLHNGRYLAVRTRSDVVLTPVSQAYITRNGNQVTVSLGEDSSKRNQRLRQRMAAGFNVTTQDLTDPKLTLKLYEKALRRDWS